MARVRAAGLFLVNNKKQILVGHPTRHSRDFWSIPKGKVEEYEDDFEAAIRETYEETNVNLLDLPAIKYKSLPERVYSHKKKVLVPFVVFERNVPMDFNSLELKCNSNVAPERGNFPEMDDFKWVSLEEARQLLHETQVACLDEIKAMLL